MNYSLLSGVFLEGLLSFLSPCVLPLLPLYLSYLAGDGKKTDEEGNVYYDPVKTSISALFFIGGIALTFVLLGFSVGFISKYIGGYSEVISLIGGTVLIIFGLHQTGLIHIDILEILGRKSMTNLDSILKSRGITLPTKLSESKLRFSMSHVWM